PGSARVCVRDQAAALTRALLDHGATPAGAEAWELLRVEAGLPRFGCELDENRAVFEVGRTKQADSYTKGCYLGQEPIVMARDRGHANRTLLGLKVEGEGPLPAGAKVLRGGEEVGQVTSSVWSPMVDSVIALAYLKRGHQEPGTVVDAGDRRAIVTSLP